MLSIPGQVVPVIVAANKTDLKRFDAHFDTDEWAKSVCNRRRRNQRLVSSQVYLTYSKENVTIPVKKRALLSRLSNGFRKIFPKCKSMSH